MKRSAERQLVEAARGGDAESFGVLYRRYYATTVWLAYSILLDRDLAEDAAQQSFVKACERLVDLRRTDRFGPWLAAICRNEACQLLRQRRRTVPVAASRTDCTGYSDPADEDHSPVRAAVNELRPMYRQIVILHYYNRMDYRQIASTRCR